MFGSKNKDTNSAAEAEKANIKDGVQQDQKQPEGQDGAEKAEGEAKQAGQEPEAKQDAQPAIPNDLELEAMSDEDIATLVADNTGSASDRETNIDFLRSLRPAPAAEEDAVEEPAALTMTTDERLASLELRVAGLEERERLLELKLRHFL